MRQRHNQTTMRLNADSNNDRTMRDLNVFSLSAFDQSIWACTCANTLYKVMEFKAIPSLHDRLFSTMESHWAANNFIWRIFCSSNNVSVWISIKIEKYWIDNGFECCVLFFLLNPAFNSRMNCNWSVWAEWSEVKTLAGLLCKQHTMQCNAMNDKQKSYGYICF